MLRIVLGRVSCEITLSVVGRGIRSREQTSVPTEKRLGGTGLHSMGTSFSERRYALECLAFDRSLVEFPQDHLPPAHNLTFNATSDSSSGREEIVVDSGGSSKRRLVHQ